MQIVIDIPNEDIPKNQDIMTVDLHFIDRVVCECTYPYIVLPKGHGDLVDRKELLKQPINTANYPSNYVRIAETIIEADREADDYYKGAQEE